MQTYFSGMICLCLSFPVLLPSPQKWGSFSSWECAEPTLATREQESLCGTDQTGAATRPLSRAPFCTLRLQRPADTPATLKWETRLAEISVD